MGKALPTQFLKEPWIQARVNNSFLQERKFSPKSYPDISSPLPFLREKNFSGGKQIVKYDKFIWEMRGGKRKGHVLKREHKLLQSGKSQVHISRRSAVNSQDRENMP